MKLVRLRKSRNWSQNDLARLLGLNSRGHISDWENGRERVPAEHAIAIDRLSKGQLTVADLRPDLHDVRVIHPEGP